MSKLTDLVSRHRRVGDLRFVAAGATGTASWVAEPIVDACAMVGTRNVPPIAVLSLGTGNELARVTGWGAGFTARWEARRLRSFARDVACGKVVGVDSWLWRAVPLRLDELGVPIEDVERVASELSRSKLGWHRSSDPGARFNGLQGRRGVGFGSAMILNAVLEPLDSAGGSGGSTGDSSEENAYLSRGSTDGTVLPPRNDRCISPLHAGLEGKRGSLEPKVWDSLPDDSLGAGDAVATAPRTTTPRSSPRTSVRYDFDLARGLAMESDDLPHHPELLFAPPPMTPPGAVRRTRQRAGARAPAQSESQRDAATTTATTSGRESFSKQQPVPTHHRRSSSVISVGSHHGPAINGVGSGASTPGDTLDPSAAAGRWISTRPALA